MLDPRVAYLMTNLMEEVLRTGTAAGVRARYNLNVPAAGKTGTSHDGWFAGYTSELLCVVWVGFDDNRELDLEGAHSAAPIWAEFMKRAADLSRVSRCASHSRRPTASSPWRSTRVRNAGHPVLSDHAARKFTSPAPSRWTFCPLHGGGRQVTNVSGWEVAEPSQAPAGGDTAPHVTGSGTDGQVQPGDVSRRAARQNRPEQAPPALPSRLPPPNRRSRRKKGSSGV